jgi:hypothetical protein
MEDFKSNPKMGCYKEGGSVKYKSRKSVKETDFADMAQDKKVVKKAFAMHDKQEHPGEKTDLSTLKKGGRTKKAVGTVKKFACGGGVYGAKKTAKDIKSIDDAKDCKPKKLQAGGMSGPAPAGPMANAQSGAMGQITELEKQRQMEKMKRAQKYLSPLQQGELISQDPRAAGLTPMSPPTMRKNGGKIKKCAEGGALKPTDAQENPGLAKLPTNVRNKMGYMRQGGKAKKMNTGGTCS